MSVYRSTDVGGKQVTQRALWNMHQIVEILESSHKHLSIGQVREKLLRKAFKEGYYYKVMIGTNSILARLVEITNTDPTLWGGKVKRTDGNRLVYFFEKAPIHQELKSNKLDEIVDYKKKYDELIILAKQFLKDVFALRNPESQKKD